MTVLTWRDMNRALLARQLLLERAPLSVPSALEAMGGLQAQYAPSMYIGLWSRVAGFSRDALTRMLEDRSVVQATLLRGTIHLVSRADYWPFAVGVRAYRPPVLGVDALALVTERLRGGPLRRTELPAEVRQMAHVQLELVRVPPSGTWERRRADIYGLAEDWLGPGDVDVPVARELLVRRYLTGFGPAHPKEIADWAGLPPAVIAGVLAGMTLRTFQDSRGRELVDLPDLPLPSPDTPAPVRFLPTWDAALLVHARRSLILPEEHRAKVFHVRMPQSIGTFLVDGQVAGTWAFRNKAVSWEAFAPLPDSVRRQVDEEAASLTAFHV
ncbi:winged helix DNA-binding domain-containing protein [Dactylosporangium sp. CS-047395]|uniref:winged helix DNA-binding domain-containing protein n=1 Tax=Dactylosporangium sp. CS-047395 TaxID=3239936 RepID=UPI003D90B33A